MGVLEEVRKRWFLIGVVAVISLAKMYPWLGAKEGPLRPEVTIKYIAVSLIFFNSGLSLKTDELKRALGHVRLHVFIQSYTLIFIPVLMTLLVKELAHTNLIGAAFISGLHIVGCMPPPVSSAVILTKAVEGNEAAAIFNSAVGSFLGIFATPVLLLILVGLPAQVPFLSIFTQLTLTVLVPLVIGQIVRSYIKEWLIKVSPPFGTIGSCILLLIIYTTFCDTFISDQIHFPATSLLSLIILVVLCQCLFLSLAYFFATMMGFTRQDIIAVLFCSTHKSLTLGIPILKIVFNGSSNLSALSLPLLVYHPTQILLGSALVPFLQNWVKNGSSSSQESSAPPSRNASPPLKEEA